MRWACNTKKGVEGMKRALTCCLGLVLVAMFAVVVDAQEMAKPEMTTISGKVIDVTCAVKGRAMMGNWKNVEQDHMTEEGFKEACATMCLEMGQPAGLFQGEKLAAVFACNPRATLVDYAAQDVDVQGFWAGGPNDDAKTFVPTQIRTAGASEWSPVQCAEIHG